MGEIPHKLKDLHTLRKEAYALVPAIQGTAWNTKAIREYLEKRLPDDRIQIRLDLRMTGNSKCFWLNAIKWLEKVKQQ